jgi:transcription elongation factor GreA
VVMPDGDAEGADGSPPPKRGRAAAGSAGSAAARRAAGAAGSAAGSGGAGGTVGGGAAARTPEVAPPVDGALTIDGAARLRAELETLTKVKRPEVIARIRAAKELGDLKENADYTAAREEQSFLEGRVQAIEARLRTAVIVDAPASGARVGLGSAVSVRIDGEDQVLTIVGASESDPTSGRISSASPVGRALLGREAGDDVVVATPAGERVFTVVSVD